MTRIIDSETHPIFPAGLDRCYPMDQPWRFPQVPARLPEAAGIVRDALAEGRFSSIADELLARMDEHGIEKSVVMQGVFPAPNAMLADLVKAHPDRLVAFACWDQHGSLPSAAEEAPAALAALEQGLETGAFRGVGELVLSRFHGLPPDQAYRGYLPTFELCRRYRAVAMFHGGYEGGTHPIPYSNPLYLEPLADAFPDVPLIVAHMGRQDVTFFEAALMLARKYPHVHLTTSLTRPDFVARVVEELGAERVLFGSDWSILLGPRARTKGIDVHACHLELIEAAALSERDRELILGESLARLLDL